MASVMCTQTLWRALLPPPGLRSRRRMNPIVEPQFQNVVFGPWAATVLRAAGQELVVAAEIATWLTAVCSLERGPLFRVALSNAVALALEDLGASRSTAAVETTLIESAPLVRLSDKEVAAELGYIASICDIELCYSSDLRRVQRRLNDLPHGGRDIPVPAEAVAARLAAASRQAAH
jgi:hypothetical protein